ncbi:MAG TPA: hypothetical protein VNY51_03995 [Candidatus Dormibacteraeota bacterium]|nr:hypothetical protein [Candidatus Dormibacteraeota bacterium]
MPVPILLQAVRELERNRIAHTPHQSAIATPRHSNGVVGNLGEAQEMQSDHNSSQDRGEICAANSVGDLT